MDKTAKMNEKWILLWDTLTHVDWISPWFPPQPDKNPIFTAFCPSLNKAIRIIEFDDSEEDYFDWWHSTTMDDTRELVIACKGSDDHIARAAKMITEWIHEL